MVGASEQEVIDAFKDAMVAAGVGAPKDVEPDGERHRFQGADDKRGRMNAWYILHLDEKPTGVFGTWKDGGASRHVWTMQGAKPMSDAERQAFRERMAIKKAIKEAEERALQASAGELAKEIWEAASTAGDHPYLHRKGVTGAGLRVGTWVKEYVDKSTGEVKRALFPNTLLIPMRDAKAPLVSLQGIFAKPIKWAGGERDKDFIYGGKKAGCWSTIGKPTAVDGVTTVGLVEGWATGATVHDAAGIAVVVAFDAGNLIKVAREIRRMKPDWQLVFFYDNDVWKTKSDGSIWNTGKTRAEEAVAEIGGMLCGPDFSAYELGEKKPTDWNDLQAIAGLEEVQRQIFAVIRPQPEPEPTVEPEPEFELPAHPGDEPPPWSEVPEGPGDFVPPDKYVEPEHDTHGYFKIQGYDRDHIYVYSHERKMVVSRGTADWGEGALISIAPITWWEMEFPMAKGGINKKAAHNWIVRQATQAGYFDPNSLRGRGAWRDDGRNVYHFGNRLAVNGEVMDLSKIDSTFIYEQGRRLRLPAKEALTTQDGKKIIDMAEKFRWSMPASAILLAGWCALAPLSGALSWRPHVWITGGAGSGKTTVLDKFVYWLMNGACLYANGNSTEPGIRQELRIDALPILFDESEQNDQRERLRVQAVLALLRQASSESGAKTFKGTQGGEAMNFNIRSMACLSSIQVGLEQQADVERITLLSLKSKKEATDAASDWRSVKAAIDALHSDKTLPARLMRRSIDMLPLTLQNIGIFAEAAAEHFGSQREGDQYGAMLAGAWSLIRDRIATKDDAKALIGKYDWTDYTVDAESEGSERALSALLGSRVRTDPGKEVTVYELVAAAAERPEPSWEGDAKKADQMLKRYGMSVKWEGPMWRGGETLLHNARFLVANNSEELRKLVERTSFAADLKGQLLRCPGAELHDTYSFLGVKSRCVSLPIPYVLDGVEVSAPEQSAPPEEELAF